MIPAFSISIGGSDVTGSFNDRLLSLEVSDHEGTESDSCSIEIDDRDGIIQIPSTGDMILISMGYVGALRPMGRFTVNSISVTGFPRSMSIGGKAADMKDTFKEQRHQDYHDKSVKDIVGEIAGRHGLSPSVLGSVGNFKYKHIAQTAESDMHFLTRLSRKHDAVAAPKNGKLIFAKKGEIDTGLITITPKDLVEGSAYTCDFKDRPNHKESQGSHWDKDKVERTIEKSSGSTGKAVLQMGKYHPDGKDEAKEASKSKADEMKRDEKTVSLTAVGNPAVMAEMKMLLVGVRAGVDDLYRIKSATHTINDSGYSTKIEGELPK